MTKLQWVVSVGLLGGLLVPTLRAADPEPAKDELLPEIREAKKLSDRIDKLIAARWAEKGVKPARMTGDGEFLRRVHLDLTGRIPRPADLLDFRDRYASNPRENWINRELLGSEEYVNHFATTWRQLIVPPDNNQMIQNFSGNIEQWLKQKFKENAHYDQLARELIASPNVQNQVTNMFFQANMLKAENLAASTSRLFLGVKLECAQCHDHPFARWTRKQFWEYAAFYSGIQQVGEKSDSREIQISGTEKTVKARFLDGTEPDWKKENSTRETLADWMLNSKNPFFARAAANRFWSHFFGIGLVEPVDDLSDQNPASHPELLDLLASEFINHNYDVKYLIRAITFSKTYQLSSETPKPVDERLFARMNLKGLSGEQLYDSIMIACDTPIVAAPGMNRGFMQPNDPRAEFIARFGKQPSRTEYHTSILQALTMMNGKIVDDAMKSNTLKKISDEPLTTSQRVEALYMAVLTRKPRKEESARFVKYIDGGGPKKDAKAALGDVFWALLNSGEFLLNH